MIHYITMDENLRKDVFDAKAVRGIFIGLDHYTVLTKMNIKVRGEYVRKNGKRKVSMVLVGERMNGEGEKGV